MLSVHILCVGRLKERFYEDAAREYIKRLGPYCKLSVTELAEQRLPAEPSQAQIAAALEQEGKLLLARLPEGAYTVALCVEGQPRSSEQLAALVDRCRNDGAQKHLVFLIGGSCGLAPAVKAKADLRLSMSAMTFPHQLARVMLLEQLYRCCRISAGERYHK